MIKRLSIFVRGAVQGVGFRPFIFNLASELKLTGFVLNNSKGVNIEVEGNEKQLLEFVEKLQNEKPRLSIINSLEYFYLPEFGYSEFRIKESELGSEKSTLILPDFAVCDDCLNEMNDPEDRRYLYPFINCTNCGPRFSIIESLPYDRPNTSMIKFVMCDKCRAEYENPSDRRFHAQPIACPDCGPQIEICDNIGNPIANKHRALLLAVEKIISGKIIALKGLGGFQLIADASNSTAINILRERKHREEKPFALMFPDIESIKLECIISKVEETLLCSPEAPIVICERNKKTSKLPNEIAIDNPNLGVMLPYTPLHHLLLKLLNRPIIATSGNISEEPICIDNKEALFKLKNLADFFLFNNRDIVRNVDDSILRVINNQPMMMRRARGYAPLPISVSKNDSDMSIISVGGHLKNTVAIKIKENIFISQHIGNLSTGEAANAFKRVVQDFQNLYETKPKTIISDLHPDYYSSKFANKLNENIISVQHHYAHIAACRLENQFEGEALGVSWDGTGLGKDNSIWGSEFFHSTPDSYKHIAQLKKFKLPGGDSASREPKRISVSLFHSIYGSDFIEKYIPYFPNLYNKKELVLLKNMLEKNINCAETTSMGRLFDGVSSMLELNQVQNFEGQAAMKLEFIADPNEMDFYNFEFIDEDLIVIDWHKMIKQILIDIKNRVSKSIISAKFHNSLSEIVRIIALENNYTNVILSGGCFQNKYLTERIINKLDQNNINVIRHQRIPPNDGGLSLGQIAAYLLTKKTEQKQNLLVTEE